MARPPTESTQLAIRVPTSWIVEADELARAMSRPGMDATRSDAFRAAMAKGLEALRAEYALKPTKKPAKK
jgi:hypothetical protein